MSENKALREFHEDQVLYAIKRQKMTKIQEIAKESGMSLDSAKRARARLKRKGKI